MARCWAAQLKGCGQQSREHSISSGLLESQDVLVAGYPWCRTKPAVVPRQRLVQKVLCTTHNSALSDTDDAAIAFRRAVWACKARAGRRLRLDPTVGPPTQHAVDGSALERWMLKTVINVGIGMTQKKWWPPTEWVQLAFGRASFPADAGMYLCPVDERTALSTTYEFVIDLLNDHGRAVGAVINIDELRFAILAEQYRVDPAWLRRPAQLIDEDDGGGIVFRW